MPLSLINPGENPQDASRSGQFSDAKTTACGWDDDATLGIMDGVFHRSRLQSEVFCALGLWADNASLRVQGSPRSNVEGLGLRVVSLPACGF